LDYFQDVGVHWGIPYALRGLGDSSCALGMYADARRDALQALQYVPDHQQMETGLYVLTNLCVVAETWIGEGQIERAYGLLAVLNQRCQDYGFTRNRNYLHALFRLDDALPPHLAAAVARGRTRDFDMVVEEVIHELTQNESNRSVLSVSQRLPNPLTERELEILHLLATGLTNREIAEALVLTPGTVRWYLNQIYSKLHVKSRTQAIIRARELN